MAKSMSQADLQFKVNRNFILMLMDVKFSNEQEIIDQNGIIQLMNQLVEIIIQLIVEYGLKIKTNN